jgi:osmotically-inducible protein OsmY
VDSYYAKRRAADLAESVKGVVSVINDIQVTPISRPDSQIRADVNMALAFDPAAESFEIRVTADKGVVTLVGEVDSYTEKMLAEELAESVRGVLDVNNELTCEFDKDRPRHEIEGDIQGRLRSDASVNSSLITVSVDGGAVTLSGDVSSAAEKRKAEQHARSVAGVRSVENKLDVKWWLRRDMDDWGRRWTDRDIRQAIVNRLLYDPRVKSFKVDVVVDEGVAVLRGTVDNLKAKQAAEAKALGTLGVWQVKNYLRVQPAEPRGDEDIAADIRSALRRDAYVDRFDIHVRVDSGHAYLSGEADSWFIYKRAENVAAGVFGVVDVKNNLDVDYDVASKPDDQIKQDIENQLWWSPHVDSDDITVLVKQGVATLQGTVNDWNELHVAEENARQGGATAVISQLKIQNDGPGG